MVYKVGDKIISKKAHACGGNVWIVSRIGADVKLKCEKCGRSLFLSAEEISKMSKEHIVADDGK